MPTTDTPNVVMSITKFLGDGLETPFITRIGVFLSKSGDMRPSAVNIVLQQKSRQTTHRVNYHQRS